MYVAKNPGNKKNGYPGSKTGTRENYPTQTYVVPRTRTKRGERAFLSAEPTAWNRLPISLSHFVEIMTPRKLKINLKSHLFIRHVRKPKSRFGIGFIKTKPNQHQKVKIKSRVFVAFFKINSHNFSIFA